MPNQMIDRWRRSRSRRRDDSINLMFRSPVNNIVGVFVVAVAIAFATGFVLWLALGQPRLAPKMHGALNPSELYDGIKIALTVVGGIGGVAALVIAYRKQRYAEREHLRQEASHTREDTKLYAERFRTASEQLGSERSGIRVAGAYAMATLADDWSARRQDCIDVLCTYIRMPYAPPAELNRPSTEETVGEEEQRRRTEERHVRHAIIRIIGAHLRDTGGSSWEGYDFNFAGAVFDGGDLSRARFSGGNVDFGKAMFVGGAVDFADATFSDGMIGFAGAMFRGGMVNFGGATFCGGKVDFGEAEFSGSKAEFGNATFCGGTVDFGMATFAGGRVDFGGAKFTGGNVWFVEATFTGSTVNFAFADFTGSALNFGLATFSNGTVRFGLATFADGTLDFFDTTFLPGFGTFAKLEIQVPLPVGVRPPDQTAT